MSLQSPTEAAPTRQSTLMSNFSEDAVPETDPSSTAGLLAERLYAWRHAVEYLEEYMVAVEKIHKAQAKEYERVLKTISKPLKYGEHFDQSLGGVAGFFENMRANTQALINTNAETEKNIKGSVLPVIERLSKEIKHKSKELSQGAQKAAKEVEKARNLTQKHIELLGQNTAAFESTGGKMTPSDDPYVIQRGVIHRLHRQVLEENNHRNDLIAVQNNVQSFEAHIIEVIQQAMEAFNSFASGQAENSRLLYSDMLGAAQRIPPDFEWKGFVGRKGDVLVNPNEDPRNADSIQFPNMNHNSTKPLIEGSLERKSRNKLDWRYQTGYYVVTPSKFLHEFKDSDNLRKDPTPELSIYLPDAVIGKPVGEKFNVKGKDRSKTMSSKLTGSSELAFKAHTAADAQKWFDVICKIVGATGPAQPSTPSPVLSPTSTTEFKEADAKEKPTVVTDHKAQEAGVTGTETVASPTALSPTSTSSPATKDGKGSLSTTGTTDTALTSPTAPTSATDEKKPVIAA